MLLGIDHLVIAVPDPDAAVDDLARLLGLEPAGGGEHPGWGTRNRLVWLGDTFVELLGITDATLAGRSWLGAPALAALAKAPTLVGWAVATDDLETDATLLRERGADLGPISDGERLRPDGATVRWRLALPPALSLDRPFLIEHDMAAAEWSPDDRATRAASAGRIARLELPVARVAGFAAAGPAITLGDQAVVPAGATIEVPVIVATGCPAAPGVARLLGCDWAIE